MFVSPAELRTSLALELSQMYAREVPLYGTLVDTCARLNSEYDGGSPDEHQRVGAERHGAVRFGSVAEIAEFAGLFALFGMYPVGLYDLRETGGASLPIIATAFRPIDPTELQVNPFRLFSSVLVPGDRRFFSADLQKRIENHVSARQLMPEGLIELVAAAREQGGVRVDDAGRLVALTVDSLRLDERPLNGAWHAELHAISPVAADIAGATSTHLNHLTPRVFDIDGLYDDLGAQGVHMIDRIQGPPLWAGPQLLLRQTSFRALDEPRTMVAPDGSVSEQMVRVRFGEVEQRGAAVTPKGRLLVDEALATDDPVSALNDTLPHTIAALAGGGFIYISDGQPITYEDFLPASAAGIFESNLDHAGTRDDSGGAERSALADLDRSLGGVADPYALYEAQSD